MKSWKGQDLKGCWEVSYKIDGVCVLVDKKGKITSRKDKPLYNLNHLKLPPGRYECFRDNWETTVSMVRTIHGAPIDKRFLYMLEPKLDPRLKWTWQGTTAELRMNDPKATLIRKMLKAACKAGFEGLVLMPVLSEKGDKRELLKVKPVETYDVSIVDWLPGKGKYKGMTGALLTEKGKVGAGLPDDLRKTLTKHCVGNIIEVACRGLTPAGKFREPRFLRLRFDK